MTSGYMMAMIATNATCDVCGCTGWALIYHGRRCLSCVRAGIRLAAAKS